MAGNGRSSGSRGSRRKEKREARLRDIRPDDTGRYAYTGDLWRLPAGNGRRKGLSGASPRMLLAAGIILLGAAVMGSGSLDSPNAIGTFYVIVPYIGEVSAFFILVWNSAKVIVPGSVRTYTLEQVRDKIPVICRILLVFAVIGLAFSAVYLVMSGTGGKPAESAAYLLLKAAAAAIAEWYRRLFKNLSWIKI